MDLINKSIKIVANDMYSKYQINSADIFFVF